MGRAPCCDKANVKKGPWSPEEDVKLKAYIEQHGTGGNWIALPQKIGLKRCGKSCRLRWLNYLRPNIKHGGFSEEEDRIICSLYISIGSRWSIIAAQLPGRTDNDVKNYWNTRLKKKLLGKQQQKYQKFKSRINGFQKKEIMKIRSENDTMAYYDHHNNNNNNNNHSQVQHWSSPSLQQPPPAPYSNQEPSFNDHESIKKLLIKLGGRFSEEEDQPLNEMNGVQFNADNSSTIIRPTHGKYSADDELTDFPLDNFLNYYPASSSSPANALCSLQGSEMPMFPGQSSSAFPAEVGENLNENYYSTKLAAGLEFFYDDLDSNLEFFSKDSLFRDVILKNYNCSDQ